MSDRQITLLEHPSFLLIYVRLSPFNTIAIIVSFRPFTLIELTSRPSMLWRLQKRSIWSPVTSNLRPTSHRKSFSTVSSRMISSALSSNIFATPVLRLRLFCRACPNGCSGTGAARGIWRVIRITSLRSMPCFAKTEFSRVLSRYAKQLFIACGVIVKVLRASHPLGPLPAWVVVLTRKVRCLQEPKLSLAGIP